MQQAQRRPQPSAGGMAEEVSSFASSCFAAGPPNSRFSMQSGSSSMTPITGPVHPSGSPPKTSSSILPISSAICFASSLFIWSACLPWESRWFLQALSAGCPVLFLRLLCRMSSVLAHGPKRYGQIVPKIRRTSIPESAVFCLYPVLRSAVFFVWRDHRSSDLHVIQIEGVLR